METKSFLWSVASACMSRYGTLEDVCFVFPNKRSGTFFLKTLAEVVKGEVRLAPQVMDIGRFMAHLSGREVGSRIDLLFRLYNVYRRLCGRSNDFVNDQDVLDFDRFAPWGETLLSDFGEIDKYDAPALEILKNVRDLRSIETNFLTPEQCDALERLLGRRPVAGDVKEFWKTIVGEEGEESDQELTKLKSRFIEMWRLLPELYSGLAEDLSAAGLTTPGGSFRLAKERVSEQGREILPWSRIVVVGFNMLSGSEARLFDILKKMRGDDGEPFAEFFWDATGPVLGAGKDSQNVAAIAMRRYKRNFPMPEWAEPFIKESDTRSMPGRITVAASPSNAAQTKIAAMTVEEWMKNGYAEDIVNARTAVVIPDENLLLPMIHSLPKDLPGVNLTMGYSMRYTSVASFIYHLRRLQAHIRNWKGKPAYWHEDLKVFLRHPLVHLIAGSQTAADINSELMSAHLRVIPFDWIGERSELIGEILTPLRREQTVAETVTYIRRVLDIADNALIRTGSGDGDDEKEELRQMNPRIERELIWLYQTALVRLLASVEEHSIEMRPLHVFHIAERLISGESVAFEGKPLKGLQIMGLLETRALDFDRIVILSMNDKIMPQRSRARSFIPAALRSGYGLPGPNQGEELYAYYFYRLISRAREVTLVYDARAGEGMRSGGKSRFLLQLEMLYARDRLQEKIYSFGLKTVQSAPKPVQKTPSVMKLLDEFTRKEQGRSLSASAFMNYCKCQVLFYYKNVVGLKDNMEERDYIDAITQGTIVHDALLNLYLPRELQRKYLESRVVLTAERLESILDDNDTIRREVCRALNRNHFKLHGEDIDRPVEGSAAMILGHLEDMVRNIVSYDLGNAPVEIVGGELAGKPRRKFGKSPEINLSYSIDRVDVVHDRMRVIDYKTGSSEVKAANLESLFEDPGTSKYLLQLLLYAGLLEERVPSADRSLADDIAVMILDAKEAPPKTEIIPEVDKVKISGSKAIRKEFEDQMEKMLLDIFDPAKPFEPNGAESTCKYCAYRFLCGKE